MRLVVGGARVGEDGDGIEERVILVPHALGLELGRLLLAFHLLEHALDGVLLAHHLAELRHARLRLSLGRLELRSLFLEHRFDACDTRLGVSFTLGEFLGGLRVVEAVVVGSRGVRRLRAGPG